MTDVTDAELTLIQRFLVAVREALSQDNSPQAQEIKKMGTEVEQIVSGKLKQGNTTPIGASTTAAVTQKTKALFSMFHRNYEPELMGGSVSVASRIVADHKVRKTKALFEMFHLT